MPRTPPYLAAPRYIDPEQGHAAPLPPEPTWTDGEIEWATLFFGGLPPDHDPDPPRHARADPDAPRCHGPRADTCTQAPTGPCLPRVCPGCLSSDTAEAYHHHCHGKAAAFPATCARPQAAEAAQTCQGGATQTDSR